MANEITNKTFQNPVAIPGPKTAWSACFQSRVLFFPDTETLTPQPQQMKSKQSLKKVVSQLVLISANGHTLPAIVNDEMPDSQPVLASIWINFVELLVVMLHCGNRYQTTVR